MKRFNIKELHRILYSPLAKKIDQSIVEKWSASFWELKREKLPTEQCDSQTSIPDQAGQNHTDYVTGKQEPFVMMLPPPNITGTLHLGHALTVAIEDALIRQRSMVGKESIWIPGFDHAGIATQNTVEKLIWTKHKMKRQEYGRDRFITLAHEWKESKRNQMKEQINRLGLALNYESEYFTLDAKSSLAVQSAFIQLFQSRLIYRTIKPVFWSKEMQTTLSDIEVETDLNGLHRYFRTGEVVERKELNQWFIDAKNMAERAVEMVEKNHIEMIPVNYKRSWYSWLLENGVQDWCISRQNWWGHRIPAYKFESSQDVRDNWVVANNIEDAKDKLSNIHNADTNEEVVQDPDILDTWFSSSLLPLTISGWPNLEEFQKRKQIGLFPLTIMETGFDILTYWVSKMVMMSLALTNEIPFKTILLHGMICDSAGKKMSKTKGNVIDPLDVIDGASLEKLQERTRIANKSGIIEDSYLDYVLEQQSQLFPKGIPACGADGLRAYLLSHDFQEEVVKIQIAQIEKVRRLSNKIWNIYRFALPLLENGLKTKLIDMRLDVELTDELKNHMDQTDTQLFAQLSRCVDAAYDCYNKSYQLQYCFNRIDVFWTQHLSNKYIQDNRKFLIQCDNEVIHEHKLKILLKTLVTSTKLLHPYMPHLSEFLYQKLQTSLLVDTKSNLHQEPHNSINSLSSLINQDYPTLAEWLPYLRTDYETTNNEISNHRG